MQPEGVSFVEIGVWLGFIRWTILGLLIIATYVLIHKDKKEQKSKRSLAILIFTAIAMPFLILEINFKNPDTENVDNLEDEILVPSKKPEIEDKGNNEPTPQNDTDDTQGDNENYDYWNRIARHTSNRPKEAPQDEQGGEEPSDGGQDSPVEPEAPDVNYVVKHEKMDLNGEDYTLAYTETANGKAGTSVTPDTKDYHGFTAPAKQTIELIEGETPEITYQYERNKYHFSYGGSEFVISTKVEGDYFYETPIHLEAKARQGYYFANWNNGETASEIDIILDRNTTITPNYEPNTDTPYIVRHRKMSIDGSSYTEEEESLTGTTDAEITPDRKDYHGYNTPAGQTTAISAAGDTEIIYEYTPRTDTPYTVHHRKMSADGQSYTEEEEPLTGTTTDTVTPARKDYPGYNIPAGQAITISAEGDSELIYEYTPKTDTEYVVRHRKMSADGQSYAEEEEHLTGTTDTEVTPARKSYAGYTAPAAQTITIEGTGDTELIYEYAPNTDTPYMVRHRKMSADGQSYTEEEDPQTGTTGAQVAPERKNYTGYITPAAQTITISAEGDSELIYEYIPISYTVVFYANNGSSETASQSMTYDNLVELNSNSFSKTGYSFDGWNTVADNSGTPYSDRQPVSNLTAEKDGVFNLYAQWSANSYQIAYSANSGTGNMDNTTCIYDRPCQLSANSFTKTGYIFNGWELGEQTFTDGQEVTNLAESGSVTLIAQWAPIQYSVKFNANGGTGEMPDQGMTYDETKALTANTFEKTGYSFNSWNTQADGQGNPYSNAQPVENLRDTNNASITLYAQWSANSYTISYDANNGAGTMENTVCTYDIACPLRENSFTRAGYTFSGWKLGDQSFTDKEEVTNLAESGTITLIAQWTANNYTVSYDANSGSGNMENTNCVYDESCTLTANSFTKVGYNFAGWKYNEQSIADEAAVTNLAESGTVTLVAQWTPISYTIAFDANGGTGEMTNQAMTYDDAKNLTANSYTKTGYRFTGWNKQSDGQGESFTDGQEVNNLSSTNGDTVTLYAQWSANNYQIEYDTNGGTGSMAATNCVYDEYCTLAANSFTKTGYTFSGWKLDEQSYTDKQSVRNLAESGTVTLVAQWNANSYTIEYEAGSGSGDMDSTVCTYDQDCSLVANSFAKTGYTFSHWERGEETYTDGQTVRNLAESGTVALVAQWTPNSYQISYNANGGSGSMENKDCTYDEPCTLTTNSFTKVGYNFAGWKYGEQNFANEATVTNLAESGIAELFAQWTPISYTIAFDANGGTGNMSQISAVYDTEKQLTLNTFEQAGYTFAGWNTQADGQGTHYPDGGPVINLTTTDGDSVTLYAEWEKIPLVCKAATELHTEVCTTTGNERGSCYDKSNSTISGGSIETINGEKIITYGKIPSASSPKPGDAYDCDLTGDGNYNERFYALTKNGDNLDLVYYTSYNVNGPDTSTSDIYDTALNKLPTKTQWTNPNLVEFSQDMIANLIPADDLKAACTPDAADYTNIDVKQCIYTLENSTFHKKPTDGSFKDGIWLEKKYSSNYYRIQTTDLKVNYRSPAQNSVNMTRPTIRVPLVLIEKVGETLKTITYNTLGGDSIPADQVAYGEEIGHLPEATGVQGYYFSGWSLTSDGQTPINEYHVLTDDITLYAIWTQTSKTASAKGEYFDSLLEAVNIVRADDVKTTVTLLQNTTSGEVRINQGQNIEFDFQNNALSTVDCKTNTHLIENWGKLEISNGTITSCTGQGAVNNNPDATLVIRGGTITATGTKQAVWNKGGNVTISGNPILSSTSSTRATVHNLEGGTMTILGGSITSTGAYAVYNQGGTLTIGSKDGNIDTTSPTITGKTYGIIGKTAYNIYDGTISGKTYPNGYTTTDDLNPTVTRDETDSMLGDIEDNSVLTKDTSSAVKTMYLTPAP